MRDPTHVQRRRDDRDEGQGVRPESHRGHVYVSSARYRRNGTGGLERCQAFAAVEQAKREAKTSASKEKNDTAH